MKIYFHVRHANGVTIDWLQDEGLALGLAIREEAQVYRVDSISGRAERIR